MKRSLRRAPGTDRRTAKDFLGVYDDNVAIPTAIKAGLAALRKIGVDEWRYELEFAKFANVANNKIGAFHEQFAAHIVEVRGRDRAPRKVWFADKAVAKRMRDALAKNLQ